MANKYTLKRIIAEFLNYTKILLADLERKEELTGKEKMKELNKAIEGWLIPILATAKFSIPFIPDIVVKFVFEKFIIKNIPVFTQAVYDLIKARIKGITQ